MSVVQWVWFGASDEGCLYQIAGEAKLTRARGQVKGLFRPCSLKELPWKPGCVTVHAWLWMKSHQWAFLWNCLAMARSTLEAGLSHFFCLSWLPCPPCTLGANGQSLPLPAALPRLCLCRWSRGAWRVYPTCGQGWVLHVQQGGITAACWKHSCAWMEGRC